MIRPEISIQSELIEPMSMTLHCYGGALPRVICPAVSADAISLYNAPRRAAQRGG